MAEVSLRPWRLEDADDVAVMFDDEYLRPWSETGADLESWLRREVAEARGPSRAICLPDDDRALGRVAVRLPEFASEAVRCDAVREIDQPAGELSYWLVPEARGRGLAYAAVRMMMVSVVPAQDCGQWCWTSRPATWPRGDLLSRWAQSRAPTRVEVDRTGVQRTLVVYVLPVALA